MDLPPVPSPLVKSPPWIMKSCRRSVDFSEIGVYHGNQWYTTGFLGIMFKDTTTSKYFQYTILINTIQQCLESICCIYVLKPWRGPSRMETMLRMDWDGTFDIFGVSANFLKAGNISAETSSINSMQWFLTLQTPCDKCFLISQLALDNLRY